MSKYYFLPTDNIAHFKNICKNNIDATSPLNYPIHWINRQDPRRETAMHEPRWTEGVPHLPALPVVGGLNPGLRLRLLSNALREGSQGTAKPWDSRKSSYCSSRYPKLVSFTNYGLRRPSFILWQIHMYLCSLQWAEERLNDSHSPTLMTSIIRGIRLPVTAQSGDFSCPLSM